MATTRPKRTSTWPARCKANSADEAVAAYRAALARQPTHYHALNNLATVLKSQGELDEAERHLQAAIAAAPRFAAAHANLALVRDMQDRLDEAAAGYLAALEIEPNMVAAHEGLGAVRQKQERFAEAATCFQHVVQRRPNDPEALLNLGVCFGREGRHDEAIAAFRRALELRPGYGAAHGNLALSTRALGLLDESIEHYRQTVELAPEAVDQYSSLLYTLNYHPDYDARTLFEEHRAWGRRHADPLTAASQPLANDRSPGRRLRVGYVSPNFYSHAVNFFVEPILASHDHERYEIFCYSDVKQPDNATARLRGYADEWRETTRLSDEELCQLVRADGIDVLVDLTGHINGGKRLLAFAQRAAPVQVTYLGYQNTTGMQAMDYRLTDAYSDPPGVTDSWHTERLVRLPTTFFVYLPWPNAPAVGPLPAAAAGHVTFGSVNNFTKITPEVLRAWAEILRRSGRSRLVIRADMTQTLRARLVDFFAAEGIDAARLDLVDRLPRREYLDLISRLDIALDPFPFNGHTTTCDCLWQGVPVVTLSGETYVSRFGGSGLVTLGLEEWIAHSREQYVETAVALAEDLPQLAAYRATLRQRMAVSPLLDFETFTRNLEDAYRRMWTDWCAQGMASAGNAPARPGRKLV